jgi:hypothetical protein
MSIPLNLRLQKYQAWRERLPVDRPMVGLLWEPDIPPLPDFIEQVGIGNEIDPMHLKAEMFLPYVEDWYRQDARLSSDVIQPFTPAFGMPWVEAIAGCRVVAYPGSLWAEPIEEGDVYRMDFRFDRQNPWLQALLRFTEAMVSMADGRFPVALPQMRGPLDLLAALRTPNQMCLDAIETPEAVIRTLGRLADLWIHIAEAVLDIIPPFHDGYSTRMKMWAPGKAITPQNDVSTLISPRMYRELVLPWDEYMFQSFPFHSYHMHATEYRHIPALLSCKRLTAIQLTLEHTLGGPSLELMLQEARRILAEKPLILVPLDLESAEVCLNELSSAGLAVMVGTNSPEIPGEYVQWLEDHCKLPRVP